MLTLLLIIIYIAFISLGLPDGLLGSAWPVMQPELGAPLSYAGILSMLIAGCTVVSALLSDRMTKKFGAGLVTAVSVAMTAIALFGFSISQNFLMLCIFAIPYGLGAGAVDAAINNFVALHYSSRHMSWLHCFWGVGAAVGPYIMGYYLLSGSGWRAGYRSVTFIQIALVAVLFISLPLWKKQLKLDIDDSGEEMLKPKKLSEVIKIKGVGSVLLAFFGYCGLETTVGLWASSYLVINRGIDAETAANFASLFYIGITVGRFLCGFIADKVGDKNMIRLGLGVILSGILMVLIPFGISEIALVGLVTIGLGCAPVYPSIIHATPVSFGKENSQALIGVQMASAYIGSTFMPPLFGVVAQYVDISIYPVFMLVLMLLMLFMTERLNSVNAKRTLAAQDAE